MIRVRSRNTNKGLALTSVALTILTVMTILDSSDMPAEVLEAAQVPAIQMAAKTLNSSSSRSPASIPGDHFAGEMNKKFSFQKSATAQIKMEMSLSCGLSKSKKNEFQVQGDFFLLLGKACQKNNMASNIVIINKSNGFTATVFELQNQRFQSDLIQLRLGLNEIIVRYTDDKGQQREEFLSVTSL